MSAARLAFFKLLVEDLPRMTAFYEAAFGLVRYDGFETPDFDEALLRQEGNDFMLALLHYKDGRAPSDPAGHGPTGFVSDDLEASVERAVAAGAELRIPPFDVGPARVAFVADPEGHEIEIIQFTS